MMKQRNSGKSKKVNDRVAEHRQRMKANGYRNIALMLPGDAIDQLDRLCENEGQSRAVVLERLIQQAAQDMNIIPFKTGGHSLPAQTGLPETRAVESIESTLKIGQLLGTEPGMARVIAVERAREVTGYDATPFLDIPF